MRPAGLLAALAAVLAVIAPGMAARADATRLGGVDWYGPLMVSGNHPGSESASDPDALEPGSGLIGCGPGVCLVDQQYVFSSSAPDSGGWTRDPIPAIPPLEGGSCVSATFCASVVQGPVPQIRISDDPLGGDWGPPVQIGDHSATTPTLTCPAADACAALLDGTLRESTAPSLAAGWHTVAGPALSAIDCPQTTLCFAVDRQGRLLVTTTPIGSAPDWTAVAVPAGPGLPVCPTASLCTLVDAATIYASGSPADPSSWRAQYTEPPPPDDVVDVSKPGPLACSPDGACVGAGRDGRWVQSTDPTGGPAAWHEVGRLFDPTVDATVSTDSQAGCAGDGQCIVVAGGVVHEIGDPAQAATWRSVRLAGPAAQLRRIDCPGASLCVAADSSGDLQASAEPTAGSEWLVRRLAQPVADVTCASVRLCAARGRRGALFVSEAPTGPASGWHRVAAVDAVASMACPSAGACLALESDGRVDVSKDPLRAWSGHSTLPGWRGAGNAAAMSCWSAHGCVIVAKQTSWSSGDPFASGPRWRRTPLPVPVGALSLACPSAARCLARSVVQARRHPSVALSLRRPLSAGARWHATRAAPGRVRCFDARTCALITHPGFLDQAALSRDGGRRFTPTLGSGILSDAPPFFVSLNDISCSPGGPCLIAASSGGVYVGRSGAGAGGCRLLDNADVRCGRGTTSG
jgi:hypothetical protein